MTDLTLAVDIGGTKMAVALVDQAGNLSHRAQVPTPSTAPNHEGDADVLWHTLADLVSRVRGEVARHDRVVVCGVGCGGPMRAHGVKVSPLNIGGWRDFPLRARLRELCGSPTFVDNDAKALALAEGWIGAASGQPNFIAIVVSTGIGGGIVLDGRLLQGRLGNAGHIGHVVVVPDGRPCRCGGRGCLEAEASGTALAAITGRPAALAPPDAVARTGMLVGRAVASTVNLLDLPLAVVSGSVALGFGEPFFAAAQQEIELRCGLEFARDAKVLPGGLGDRGPLIGAGCVGWHGLEAVA